jgi:protoporphyrinogen/coproporphyrinogen III oxidase
MKSVAIIGGGITGLTAAFRLKNLGLPVTVYEGGARAGGVIQSVRKNGFLAEFGPNSILETSPSITNLVVDLGLQKRRVNANREAAKRFIVRRKKPVQMPSSPPKFFTTPLFSTGAKLRLLIEPLMFRCPAEKEESLENFVLRRLGRDFLDYAINPFVGGIYAGNPAKLSVKHAFPKLHALEQKYGSLLMGQFLGARERKKRGETSKQDAKPFSFANGLQELIDALQQHLGADLKLNTPVHKISETQSGWQITAGTETIEHDSVILALPAHKLANVSLKTRKPADLKLLEQVYYPPVASIVLGFHREDVAHPLDGFGMLIPQKENFSILGCLFSSSLFPNRAPDGDVTLTCYIGGARNPDFALLPHDQLVSTCVKDLNTILGINGGPVFQHVHVFQKAIPQYEIGYGRFKERMTQIENDCPGLFFAGHARDGISLGDSILSGHRVAERIATSVLAETRGLKLQTTAEGDRSLATSAATK